MSSIRDWAPGDPATGRVKRVLERLLRQTVKPCATHSVNERSAVSSRPCGVKGFGRAIRARIPDRPPIWGQNGYLAKTKNGRP